jgi:hypothetical protein
VKGLLSRARAAGLVVGLRPDGGLSVSGPQPLPTGILAEIAAHKAEVIAELGRELADAEAERERRMLVGWIRTVGGICTVRALAQGPRQFRSPGAAEAALDGLVRARLAHAEWASAGDGGQIRTYALLDPDDPSGGLAVRARARSAPVDVDGLDGPGAPETPVTPSTSSPSAREALRGVTRLEIVFEDGPNPKPRTPAEERAWAELRERMRRADAVEAAARARRLPVPDHDDPSYWAWYDAQPDPPPPDAGPWPKQTVVVDIDDDGRIVSGPLCDAEGREVAP